MVIYEQKLLYLDKVVVFGQSGCVREKFVVLGYIYCNPAKWFYSGKVVVFGQSGCNRTK